MANGDTKEKGIYKSIINSLKQIEGSSVQVGYFPDQKSNTDASIYLAGIAAVHEYGSPKRGIPQRSFLGANADKNRAKYQELLETKLSAVMLNKIPLEKALSAVGVIIVGDVKTFITNLRTPPNKPSTIARKGSSSPLIDTGYMKNQVKFKVKS